jgi:cell wall-associated NlpC family hydrolase
MKRFFLLFFIFFLLPTTAIAGDFDDCSDTPECTCEPSDPFSYDGSDLESIADCQSHCIDMSLIDEEVTGYSIQCTIDGIASVVGQGDLESIEEELSELADFYDPELGVEIPGLEFTPAYTDGESTVTNYLGEYVIAVYTWLVPVASLLAVVVLMIAGLQYMLARGNQARIGKAKERITYDALRISYIDPQEYVDESPDTAGAVSGGPGGGSIYIPPSSEMKCDTIYTIEEIALSTVGWITYRYGGKGGDPIYTAETKTDPDGRPYSEYCPDETICLDCSGYADFVRQCAGLEAASESSGTAGIFDTANGAELIDSWDDSGMVNGEQLEPGDMIGYPSSHVLIYLGDGVIADSHGSGRAPGDAIGIYDFSYGVNLYLQQGKTPYVRRR